MEVSVATEWGEARVRFCLNRALTLTLTPLTITTIKLIALLIIAMVERAAERAQ
jgi:hypothetical protein